MKVAVFGVGYVGFTSCCCLAESGHTVIGVDVDTNKVRAINEAEAPFYEPGLAELHERGLANGLLSATTNAETALHDSDIALVCVGTPSAPDGSHNMQYIIGATRSIARALAITPHKNISKRLTLVFRSTVKPGTMRTLISDLLYQSIGAEWRARVELVFNPEFLREGMAIKDYFEPSRIVIGTENAGVSEKLSELYADINCPTFVTAFEEAELIKFIDNTWHATKVAFANEVGRLTTTLGISSKVVHSLFVADNKLNLSSYYTRPGGAFGGSCLPKDTRAILNMAEKSGVKMPVIGGLLESNKFHEQFITDYVCDMVPKGAKILINGIAFKAGTDDVRESPNLRLVSALLERGMIVTVYDLNVDPHLLTGKNFSELATTVGLSSFSFIDKDQLSDIKPDLIINTSESLDHKALSGIRTFNIFELAEGALSETN